MRHITVINQKGGVGKTTTTANLGAALALRNQRVLLVDLDPQAHLTLSFSAEPSREQLGVYEVLTRSAAARDALVKVGDNLWMIPAHTDLVAAESELVSVVGREVILRDALEALDGQYDYMLIDCPPSLGILTLNALAAAHEVLIPLQPHFLALQGLAKLLETVSLVQTRINPGLTVCGIALCMFEAGTRLAGEVVDDLRRFLEAARGSDAPWSEARVFDRMIRRNIKLAEAPGHGLSIFDYAPRSNGARDYQALAAELLGETQTATADQTPASQDIAAADEPSPAESPTSDTASRPTAESKSMTSVA